MVIFGLQGLDVRCDVRCSRYCVCPRSPEDNQMLEGNYPVGVNMGREYCQNGILDYIII